MILIYMTLAVALLSVAWYAGYHSRPVIKNVQITSTSLFSLREAKVCMDCESIFQGTTSICKACGSSFSWPLANWLGTMESNKELQTALPVKVIRGARFTTA